MNFVFRNITPEGNAVLEGDGHVEPVARPTKVFLGSKVVGTIFDTIGRVESPFYLMKPSANATQLAGKKLCSKER